MAELYRDQKDGVAGASASCIKAPPIHKLVIVQVTITLLASVLALVFSLVHGYSALLGGLICAIPNTWFAYRSFKYRGARASQQIVKSFYRGEAVKLLLTALLFGATFKFVQVIEPVTVFAVFFLVQLSFWLTPLLFNREQFLEVK